jgi:hypothetical protein
MAKKDNEEILLLKVRLEVDPKTAKTQSELEEKTKKLKKALKDAPLEGTENYKKLEKTIKAANKRLAENESTLKKLNKERRVATKEIGIKRTSLKGMSLELARMENQYKLLDKEERRLAKNQALRKKIAKTRMELIRAERGLQDYRRGVGRYASALGDLNLNIAGVGVSVGTLTSGLGSLVSSFRNAGTAAKVFLLTLGPITVALALITAALAKFESITDRIKTTLSGVGAIVDVVTERIGRAALAFQKLNDFDFAGFAADFKAAFTGIAEEASKEAQAAVKLSEDLLKLKDKEIASIFRLAQLNLEVQDQKQKAQEQENTNAKAAIQNIDNAIAAIEERRDIELGIERERLRILSNQVDLTNELTRRADREAVERQRAKVLEMQAKATKEITGLIRRRNLLLNKGNAKQLDDLQKLQKEQSRLTNEIKLQILAGQDYTKSVEDLKTVTAQLLAVNEKFKELTEETEKEVKTTTGSVRDYTEQINKLSEEQENTNTESERYAEIQAEILRLEAQRAVAVGEVSKSIGELNRAQLENLTILEDAETTLRLRAKAFEDIQALEGSPKEVADRRLAIEKKLNQDLRQLELNRINDQKAELKKELNDINTSLDEELALYADNELKKQEIQLIAQGKRDEIRQRELELEKQLLDISKKNFDESEKSKTKSASEQEKKREQLRDLAIETSVAAAQKITELLSVLQSQATEKELEEIEVREEAELKEAERLGKTEEEKQKIRDKFAAQREEIEKRAAEERKAIAIAEATIDIAGAVIKSLNTAPPANVALAAATAALGAIQLAIIAATNFANGGLVDAMADAQPFANGGRPTVRPVKLSNGRIINTPNIPEMSNGDNIFATVRKNEAVINEEQQERIGKDVLRAAGVPGFARGGRVDFGEIQKAYAFNFGGLVPRFSTEMIYAKAMQNGGVAAVNATQSVSAAIGDEAEKQALIIARAVYLAAKEGTKEGTESADIAGQITRQNERTAARDEREDF